MRRALVVALAMLLLAPVAARAQSRRWGSFEIGAGTYRPNIDSEPGLARPTFAQFFGNSDGWMFRAALSRVLLTYPGSLEVGLRTGYMRRSGHGLQMTADGSTISDVPSSDTTAFNVIPTTITVTYRLDMLPERYHVPLAPYVRLALERYNWWVTKGDGGSARNGATNGYSAAAGLALQLDIFDRQAARELQSESGIDHTYLFAEIGKSWIDDFGSSSSWDLSNQALPLSFGLLFTF